MLGVNVEELRALAREFSARSQSLKQMQSTLDGAVNNLPNHWNGPDAHQFAQRWRTQQRGVIERSVAMLADNSKVLIRNADEQEKASAVDSASGPSGASSPGSGSKNYVGPDFLADPNSPFRDGWTAYNWAKLYPNLRAGVFDLAAMLTRANRPGFMDPAAWKLFRESNIASQFFNASSDLADGKWHQAFNLAEGSKAFKFFDFAGKGLGGLGVGLDALDGVNSLLDGKGGDAAYSFVKAGLGAAAFAPPPVGTAAAVASGALFLYDNVPAIHDSVNYVGGKIADGAKATADAVGDGAKKVAKFFGF